MFEGNVLGFSWMKKVPQWSKPLMMAAVTGLVGVFYPQVRGDCDAAVLRSAILPYYIHITDGDLKYGLYCCGPKRSVRWQALPSLHNFAQFNAWEPLVCFYHDCGVILLLLVCRKGVHYMQSISLSLARPFSGLCDASANRCFSSATTPWTSFSPTLALIPCPCSVSCASPR